MSDAASGNQAIDWDAMWLGASGCDLDPIEQSAAETDRDNRIITDWLDGRTPTPCVVCHHAYRRGVLASYDSDIRVTIHPWCARHVG